MDSYTKIVSSKFIVDSPMVLLGQLSTLFKETINVKDVYETFLTHADLDFRVRFDLKENHEMFRKIHH